MTRLTWCISCAIDSIGRAQECAGLARRSQYIDFHIKNMMVDGFLFSEGRRTLSFRCLLKWNTGVVGRFLHGFKV